MFVIIVSERGEWWATGCSSCSRDPRDNCEQMAEDHSYSPLSSILCSLWFFQLPNISLSNFSERGKLLRADTLFCFCLLNIWAALVMEADWKDQAPLFSCRLFVNEKLKARTAIQALLPARRDDEHASAYVLVFCLTSFPPFFLSV